MVCFAWFGTGALGDFACMQLSQRCFPMNLAAFCKYKVRNDFMNAL
jgi:hypothetical protein